MSQMLPQDMMAALGGGGGAPMGGGGLPPDMAALMGGGGGAPAPAAAAPPAPTDGSHGGGQDNLEQAIALLDQAIADEADQEDQQVMRQCSAKLQQILAKNQSEADAGLSGTVSPKALRKQVGAGGGY
jgi:hypothetical protein